MKFKLKHYQNFYFGVYGDYGLTSFNKYEGNTNFTPLITYQADGIKNVNSNSVFHTNIIDSKISLMNVGAQLLGHLVNVQAIHLIALCRYTEFGNYFIYLK